MSNLSKKFAKLDLSNQFYVLLELGGVSSVKKMSQIFSDVSALDYSLILWEAESDGAIKIKGDNMSVVKPCAFVDPLRSGENVEYLYELIPQVIKHTNSTENDIERYTLVNFLEEYKMNEVLTALVLLVNDGLISEYSLATKTNSGKDNEFTFYSLPNNATRKWGNKQLTNGESNK